MEVAAARTYWNLKNILYKSVQSNFTWHKFKRLKIFYTNLFNPTSLGINSRDSSIFDTIITQQRELTYLKLSVRQHPWPTAKFCNNLCLMPWPTAKFCNNLCLMPWPTAKFCNNLCLMQHIGQLIVILLLNPQKNSKKISQWKNLFEKMLY